MAISLAYGILFGTMFILFILPHLVLLFNRINLGWKQMISGKQLEPEMVEVAVINKGIEDALESNKDKYTQ